MTDEELLGLAAKAYFPDCPRISYVLDWVRDCYGDWDPLTDDGDRYRLAKKLKFVIDFELETLGVDIAGEWVIFQWGSTLSEEKAFVLAAAEIGKTLG